MRSSAADRRAARDVPVAPASIDVRAARASIDLRAARAATRLAFLVAGFATAGWAPLIPFAQQRARLDERELGVLLLGLGVGSVVAMPTAGALVARLGCRAVLIGASALIAAALPCLSSLSSLPSLMAALVVFGAGVGALDCAMNVQAVQVERLSGRALMSGFHGLFSLGGIVGAAGVSALLGAGATPWLATWCLVGCMALSLAFALRHALSEGAASAPPFALPRGTVLLLGALSFIAFLAEGAVLDWSAVFLTTQRGIAPALAGLGYAAFSATMTVGRLSGDAMVRRFGARATLTAGALCAALGLAVAVTVPAFFAALLGFALVGAGCANIVPVLFSAAGNQQSMPESTAIPAVTLLGYAGILAGPAGIGFVARATSLPVALLSISVALLGIAIAARVLRL